jgi:hypothetical protein
LVPCQEKEYVTIRPTCSFGGKPTNLPGSVLRIFGAVDRAMNVCSLKKKKKKKKKEKQEIKTLKSFS